MLEHLNPTPQKPSRVVVLGAYGFVGGTCTRLVAARGVPVLPLDKDDIDLTASGAAEQLQTRLAPDDALLVVSARAPCKDTGMMVDNIRIMHAVCMALERSSVNHVVYFSSDAVYSDAPVPLTEESRTEPHVVAKNAELCLETRWPDRGAGVLTGRAACIRRHTLRQ